MSPLMTAAATALSLLGQAAGGQSPKVNIFPYQQADEARQLARDQCKPLTLHFVPDNKLGADQLVAFYKGPTRVTDEILEKVVIVALPTEKFAKFAKEYGITEKGGYRTISPYDLGVFERESVGTVRSGFV